MDLHFARVGAEQKTRIVAALKCKEHITVGHRRWRKRRAGVAQSRCGHREGPTSTDVARESADMILLDDNFASIVAAIVEGRTVYRNIRKFLTYILTSNIPEIVPYLAFVLFRIPLPLTIIQILAVESRHRHASRRSRWARRNPIPIQ